ncbi:MAG: hypothetical protein HN348_07915 [Proteobacteria bacterium]|nr:hypothetical protein [Pseudomonadota bacterium]
MPIKPPNLDDRKYADIVREARALIPQYCPEWTNLSDADPGMTLVQLFAWMTEMTIYRLNRVPDKTYIHFLNFIGEERRQATAAMVPLTFYIRNESKDVVELPPYARCSTKQKKGADALHFLTTEPISVHDCTVERVVAVAAGPKPMVREIPFVADANIDKALLFADGRGVQVFKMDPVEHGPRAYTPYQYIYIAHDDFKAMDFNPANQTVGRMRMRTASAENLPIGALFKWEFFTQDGWVPIAVEEEEDDVLGLPEISLKANLQRMLETESFGLETDPFEAPEAIREEPYWIRGTIDYERWLAHRMSEDLEITWRDDRGGEERLITNWDVRDTGRNLEFFIQDMPPIRGGWVVRFTVVDRSMPAGRNAYFPKYRWTYRRNEKWEPVPNERIRYQGTSILLTGPFTDMANDGYNLRAERIETVFVRGFLSDLEMELTWLRPVVIHLAYGPETAAAGIMELHELPQLPWQPAPTLPPLLGMKFFVGSDLFENRAQKPVMLELEIGFELDSELIEDPSDLYHLQMTYRAADTWRVVYTEEGTFAQFTFADLDPEGALEPARRKIRIFLDPKKQLKGLFRATVATMETCWLRIEITRASMTVQEDKKSPPQPIAMKIFSVKLGVEGVMGRDIYEQPMPGLKVSTVEYREHNRRLTRVISRSAGRLAEHHPFDTFIDIADDAAGGDKTSKDTGHHALYVKYDKPFPAGQRHAITFRCRGETYLPEGIQVNWEMLEDAGFGRLRWGRLPITDEVYALNRSGVLEFPNTDPEDPPTEGVWMRALFRAPQGEDIPALPPLSHLMLNTVEGVNLHEFRMEKFSGEGVPHQSVQLRRFPVFLHSEDNNQSQFTHPDRFPDMRVYVTEEDGERREWRKAPGNTLLTASKDDRVFTVDTVEGSLTFGNGIRGKMLPVGSYNVAVELYHTVPGDEGNVAAGEVGLAEGFADLVGVSNLLPATGGRNAESIEEIIRRAPSVLTSRDRAVTRLDFEIIAMEASGEVARAACDGRISDDGVVPIVILPQRREGETVPDPFLSTGLKEHVQLYLGKRCLVNVRPNVRLATFQEVDVSVTVRLRPNANFIVVREAAKKWVSTFLDPYDGGLDGAGWPFTGTLYAQDFGRMVKDIPEVRHVVEVQVYEVREGMDAEFPGWEKGQGVTTLVLDKDDLFVLRHVRVVSEEGES